MACVSDTPMYSKPISSGEDIVVNPETKEEFIKGKFLGKVRPELYLYNMATFNRRKYIIVLIYFSGSCI